MAISDLGSGDFCRRLRASLSSNGQQSSTTQRLEDKTKFNTRTGCSFNYCVFSLTFWNFSELCQFSSSAGDPPA